MPCPNARAEHCRGANRRDAADRPGTAPGWNGCYAGCATPRTHCRRWFWPGALALVADDPVDPMTLLHRLVDADPRPPAIWPTSPRRRAARRRSAGGRQPRTAGGPRRRPGALPALRRLGSTIGRSGRRRQRRRPRRLRQEPPRARVAVETMRTRLEPLCSSLDVAPEPRLSNTAALWHLRTPIRGTLRDTATTALDLALALHPTPAVGGSDGRRGGRHRRHRGRPRLLRRCGRLVRCPRGRPLGGGHPRRGVVRRSPQRAGPRRWRHRGRIRPR